MDDQLLFLQFIYEAMEKTGITCSFDVPLKENPAFWDQAAKLRETADREALEEIAACLREDTTDFLCMEQIIFIVERRGLSTTPRHDF